MSRRRAAEAKIGLVVEGDTEFRALPSLRQALSTPPLKPVNLGGVGGDTPPSGIARRVKPKVEQLQVDCARVVIVLDREARASCVPAFAADVLLELDRLGVDIGDVTVVVADRMFESWLVAAHKPFDGQSGAVAALRRHHPRYHKATDGQRLFERLPFATARRNSKSLDKLLRSLGV